MFESLPFAPRKVEATEARLTRIYEAAKLGLKGDSLALASGMLPAEYRQLVQLDPIAEMAAQKGKARVLQLEQIRTQKVTMTDILSTRKDILEWWLKIV